MSMYQRVVSVYHYPFFLTFSFERIIKYLISNLRFVISEITTSYSNMKKSSIKSLKSIINLTIVKKFCEIVRNITFSKKWKKDISKIIAEIAIYLLILNKRSKMNLTMRYSNVENVISSYHYVTVHDFRISKKTFCSASKWWHLRIEKISLFKWFKIIAYENIMHTRVIIESVVDMSITELHEKNVWWEKHYEFLRFNDSWTLLRWKNYWTYLWTYQRITESLWRRKISDEWRRCRRERRLSKKVEMKSSRRRDESRLIRHEWRDIIRLLLLSDLN
jgi:hypothetical protein